MLSLTRLFKGLLGDKNSNGITCSSNSVPQGEAAAAANRSYTTETNCLSAVFFRGAGNGNNYDDDDARSDTGYVKAREAASGRSVHEPRPLGGLQIKGNMLATDALEERRQRAILWKKSSGPRRLARKDALREAEPTPPVQQEFGLPESCSACAPHEILRERVTCPPMASAQRPMEAIPAGQPERHTFPKAQASQPRPLQDPDSESDWNGSHPYQVAGDRLVSGGGGRGQLMPTRPAAAAPYLTPIALPGSSAAAAPTFIAAREPHVPETRAGPCAGAVEQRSPLSRPPQHVQPPVAPPDLDQPLDQGTAMCMGMPSGDGLLFLAADVPPALLRPDGGLSTRTFRITQQLHRGYASSVYKAVCRTSGNDVVLKAYNLAGLSDFLLYQMLRELDIHSQLRHPAIVKLLAAFKEGDTLVMVLDYAGGGSACRVRRKLGGRMTEFQAMHLVLLPLLGVLAHLHERGIVHRDIKPENLLFTESWQLKLCDYGVSICIREERAVTRTGSREYMAPEVSSCPLKHLPEDNKDNPELSYGTAVDVWSLGSLMYELLVGFTPFPGGPPARREGARGSAGARLAFPGGISQEARAFIRDCLELEPADRPTVHQLMEHAWVQEALVDAANGPEGALLAAEERLRQRRCGSVSAGVPYESP